MHECPECGQFCYCSGDIDDCPVMSNEWVYENCQCECQFEDDDDWCDDTDLY
jgi:hypothetical protein